jgi:hypothetical protein
MESEKRTEYLTRASLMSLLSDDEAASVSTAETAVHLPDGEEYIDLGRLSSGVLRSRGADVPMGRALPRSAVHKETWEKILTRLEGAHLSAPARGVR